MFFPIVAENGYTQIRATSLLGRQSTPNGSSAGQGDLCDDGRPATQGRTLQLEEEEDAPEEALNGYKEQDCPIAVGSKKV